MNLCKIPAYLAATAVVMASFAAINYPATGQPADEDGIIISTRKSKGDFEVYIENKNPFDVTLTLDVSGSNFLPSVKIPLRKVLAPYSRKRMMTLIVRDKNKNVDFYTNYSWFMGDIHARHDDSYIYKLPYKEGKSYRLVQGFDGTFSHSREYRYAIDFEMPVGTPVYAAREGIVVQKEEHYSGGGDSEYFVNRANFVIIRHDDGTLGEYAHLKTGGVIVNVGDKVRRGQHIAYSGNTGYSSGPHLHFMVSKVLNKRKFTSLPFKFRSRRGIISSPVKDEYYVAE